MQNNIHKRCIFNNSEINILTNESRRRSVPLAWVLLDSLEDLHRRPSRRRILALAASLSTQMRASRVQTDLGWKNSGATDGVHRHRWGVEREAARGQRSPIKCLFISLLPDVCGIQATLKSRIHPVAVARLKVHSLCPGNIEYKPSSPKERNLWAKGAHHRPNRRFNYGRATLQTYPSYNAATMKT